jgi:hypothetical protein
MPLTRKQLFYQLITAVNGVEAAINKQTLQLQRIITMLDPVKLATLFNLVTQLLQTHSTDSAKIEDLQSQIADLTTKDAALSDPALETQMEGLIAAATAAVPTGPAPAPVTTDPNTPAPVTT